MVVTLSIVSSATRSRATLVERLEHVDAFGDDEVGEQQFV
jgi:hypothetical protein